MLSTTCNKGINVTYMVKSKVLISKLKTGRTLEILVQCNIIEQPHGKTNNLHMRKQRRRSASR